MAPVSERWRSNSPTKNGLPSVSRETARASPAPSSAKIVTGRGLHEGEHAGVVETAQFEVAHPRLASKRGQRLGQGIGDARGRNPGRSRTTSSRIDCARLDQLAQQLEAGLVGPLQVVEHQHHGPGRRLLPPAVPTTAR